MIYYPIPHTAHGTKLQRATLTASIETKKTIPQSTIYSITTYKILSTYFISIIATDI